jgi:hypothetical protein
VAVQQLEQIGNGLQDFMNMVTQKSPLPPFDKGGNLLLPFAKGGREGFDSRFHTLPYL